MVKRKLTTQQRSFVAEYLKDQNATQAYLRVYGGSTKSAEASGPRLLGNVRVKIAVEKGLARLLDRANITAERNLARIAEIAYHNKKVAHRDVLKACELVGRTFGQFKDVHELSGKNGEPINFRNMPDEEIDKEISKLDKIDDKRRED